MDAVIRQLYSQLLRDPEERVIIRRGLIYIYGHSWLRQNPECHVQRLYFLIASKPTPWRERWGDWKYAVCDGEVREWGT